MTPDEPSERSLRPRPTHSERQAGLARLAWICGGLVFAAVLVAVVLMAQGTAARAALSAGAGVVGVLLVIVGVAAFSRTGALRRTRGVLSLASADDRREAERLALGLLGLGVAFSSLALVIG